VETQGGPRLSRLQVIVAPAERPLEALAAHVRALQREPRPLLYLAADRPYRTLAAAFHAAGIDTSQIHFLDAVSSIDGKAPDREANVTFVPSPTMLEMMAMRLEQLASRLGSPHVIIDSLSTLALYSGPGPVQQFSHYVANRLRARGLAGDFLVGGTQEGRALRERIAGYVDREVELEVPA